MRASVFRTLGLRRKPIVNVFKRHQINIKPNLDGSRSWEAPSFKLTQLGCNNECQEGAKLSEHAFADAIDVMGFGFEKAKAFQVSPRTPETPEGRFQAAIRSEACRHFTTVLGPGSDGSHEDHLHLDLRSRNKGFRICQ